MRGKEQILKYIGVVLFCLVVGVGATFLVAGKQALPKVRAWLGHYVAMDMMDSQYQRQLITADSSTSRTIMWESALAEENAVVEYRLKGKEGKGEIKQVAADNVPFTDDGETVYFHKATLHGLLPGYAYEYRIGYDNKRGPWTLMRMPVDKSFKALIFPDSQSNDYTEWQQLAHAAYERNKDTDFFVNMGDLVDNGEDRNQWEAWFDGVEPMMSKIPFVGVMGNHETYNLQWKVREPRAYLSYFAFPKAPAEKYQNHFYSFNYNGVHFVVLDTQYDEQKDSLPQLMDDQIAWLKADLAKSKAPWKVVLMHKDPFRYTNNKRPDIVPGFNELGEKLMPIFDEYKVDLVLSAHYHTYRRRGHVTNFARSTDGPMYIITGVAGNVRYPNLWRNHPLDEFVAPQPETDNYLVMIKEAHRLKIEAFLPDGTLLDSVTLEKENDD